MADSLPLPEKRRGFTKRQRFMIATGQDWKCNICGCEIGEGHAAFEVDHIHRLDALGKHEPSNWQALCVPCHAEKTRIDNREAKKGRRLRGERKPRPKRQIVSRGFDRSKSRGFDGKVRERK